MIRTLNTFEISQASKILLPAIHEVISLYTGIEKEEELLAFLEEAMADENHLYSFRNCLVSVKDNEIEGVILSYDGSFFEEKRNDILEKYQQKLNLPIETKAGEFYIDALAVHPEHRRKGIAKQLIQAVIEANRNTTFKKVTLLCDQQNSSAAALYQQLDFVKGDVLEIGSTMYWKLFAYYRD